MDDPEGMDDRELMDELRLVRFLEAEWGKGGYVPSGVTRDKAALEAEIEKRRSQMMPTEQPRRT
jgi:hypothetical protein